MSILLDRILEALVDELVRTGKLELRPGVEIEELVRELRAKIAEAPPFSQAGPVLGRALTDSELVDDLYATDEEIIDAMRALDR